MIRPTAIAALVLLVGSAVFFAVNLKTQSPMQQSFDAAVWADEEVIY